MRHAACRQLHASWDALRGGRPAPDRDEIDPAAIRGILASVFLLDVAARPPLRPEDAAFRLTGTRLDALFGCALRGAGFDRIWAPGSSALAAGALDAVLEGMRPVVAAARGGPEGREAVDIELLFLPLGSGRNRGAQVLGCLATFSVPGWMGLSAALPLDLLSVEATPSRSRGTGFGRRMTPFAVHGAGRGGTTPAAARPDVRSAVTAFEFRAP